VNWEADLAATTLEHHCRLLHDDKDFLFIAKYFHT